jgi:hypothetical protein
MGRYKFELIFLAIILTLFLLSVLNSHGFTKITCIAALSMAIFVFVVSLPEINKHKWKKSKLRNIVTGIFVSTVLAGFIEFSIYSVSLGIFIGILLGYFAEGIVKNLPLP